MPGATVAVLAHEMGHNFGFRHDNEIGSCACDDPGPQGLCIMNSYAALVTLAYSLLPYFYFLPRDAMHKRCLCRHAVSVCVSVCPSVTFVDHVKTNKRIFKIFSLLGRPIILVFSVPNGIFRRGPP